MFYNTHDIEVKVQDILYEDRLGPHNPCPYVVFFSSYVTCSGWSLFDFLLTGATLIKYIFLKVLGELNCFSLCWKNNNYFHSFNLDFSASVAGLFGVFSNKCMTFFLYLT